VDRTPDALALEEDMFEQPVRGSGFPLSTGKGTRLPSDPDTGTNYVPPLANSKPIGGDKLTCAEAAAASGISNAEPCADDPLTPCCPSMTKPNAAQLADGGFPPGTFCVDATGNVPVGTLCVPAGGVGGSSSMMLIGVAALAAFLLLK
jgi:hypothetical protein